MTRTRNLRSRTEKVSLGSVDEIMTANVVTAEPLEAARVAWERMRRRNTSHIVVAHKGKLLGIVSERDLAALDNRNARKDHMVEDLMTAREADKQRRANGPRGFQGSQGSM
jgi:predicted transcriptional regulator